MKIHPLITTSDELASLCQDFPQPERDGVQALVQLYGDASILATAARVLPALPAIQDALRDQQWLSAQLVDTAVTFDLADLRGYAYYSGARFAIYAQGSGDALVRGGRYDEVGAVFGRNRPAVGFSLDLKQIVGAVSPRPLRAAIRAPWGHADDLRAAIAALRVQGETVVCILPGHESEVDEFHCDRMLIPAAGQWIVQAI